MKEIIFHTFSHQGFQIAKVSTVNNGRSLLPFFQGNLSRDVSKVQRPGVVCCVTGSRLGYGKTLASRSHYALRFPVRQQSEARSIRYRSMTCVNATDNVSF